MARDTKIADPTEGVLEALAGRCEAALSTLGVEGEGRVWSVEVPRERDVGYPRVVLDGTPERAERFDTIDKEGIAYEAEISCYADNPKMAIHLAKAVQEACTDFENPVEPDSFQHLHHEIGPRVSDNDRHENRPDTFGYIVIIRYFFRTA